MTISENTADFFTLEEMFLLASGFGANTIFGLPGEDRLMIDEDRWKAAADELKNKQIVDSSESLTKGGAYVIHALEQYHQSKSYVRLQNLLFGIPKEDADELILLVEKEPQTQYQLYQISVLKVLGLLIEKFPLIRRAPLEDEQEFLLKELTQAKRREIEALDDPEHFINLELFDTTQSPQIIENKDFYRQWILMEYEGELVAVDAVDKTYYRASQYWLMKVLFDALQIPYKKKPTDEAEPVENT